VLGKVARGGVEQISKVKGRRTIYEQRGDMKYVGDDLLIAFLLMIGSPGLQHQVNILYIWQ
jgi:hypothetical protein